MSGPDDNRERREAAQAFAAKAGADLPPGVVAHWRSQFVDGRIDPGDVAALVGQLREAVRRLLSHMQTDGSRFSETHVHEKYAPVLVAEDVQKAVEVAILIESIDVRLDLEFARPLLTLAPDEASSRLSRLKEWMGRTYIYDVVVTPVLAEFLAQPGDFESKLSRLDRLAEETEHGRFNPHDPLQRDLEYQKFSHEYHRLYGTNRRLPYVNEPPTTLYRKFNELPVLDHEHRDKWRLEGQQMREVKRAGYEAAEFLRFLRRFRAGTSRPIVVVGNNRYGRQWVVEPLEELLRDGFTLRYDGVPSHMSTRLSVASARNFEQSADNTGPWTSDAFPMDFVRKMERDMPHIVVADAKSSYKYDGDMMLSRAAKTYANWVAAFNYVRAEGDVAAYRHESCLPLDHLGRLVHWYEFVRVRRQLEEWVTPGPTYSVGLWAPQTTDTAQLGELPVPFRPPMLDTDRPQFVLANPLLYDDAALPEHLHGTTPYYFDGPEKYVREEIVFGFGPYGFQPAVKGTMTTAFVAALQRAITEEVKSLTAAEA